jgi:hypothetical protein
MYKEVKNKVAKSLMTKLSDRLKPLSFVVIFAVIGGLTLYFTHAATPGGSIEFESGSLSGSASQIFDPSASGGRAVKFGAPAVSSNNGTDTSCVFQKADQPVQQAFCDGFSTATVSADGSRSGELNSELWGASRGGDWNPGSNLNKVRPPLLLGCGADVAAAIPPKDIRICNGRMIEAQDDTKSAQEGGGVIQLTIYPKQPFDFANRTGTVVFDVSNDSGGSHASWPEFVITDKPNPAVRTDVSAHTPPGAANEVGFSMAGGCVNQSDTTGVDKIFVTRNNVYQDVNFNSVDCVKKASGPTGAMNHFEMRINTSRAEIYASDPGGANFKLIATADNLNLTFTKGLVWMNHVNYNARKEIEPCQCGTQYHHTFAWDNLGFDGPKTYRDLSFDVLDKNDGPDADGRYNEGWVVGKEGVSLKTLPVYRKQTPTSALVTFYYYSFAAADIPSISINGHTPVNTAWPFAGNTDSDGYFPRSLAVPVPLADVTDGVNTITFKAKDGSTSVANVNLILVAGAPVP